MTIINIHSVVIKFISPKHSKEKGLIDFAKQYGIHIHRGSECKIWEKNEFETVGQSIAVRRNRNYKSLKFLSKEDTNRI